MRLCVALRLQAGVVHRTKRRSGKQLALDRKVRMDDIALAASLVARVCASTFATDTSSDPPFKCFPCFVTHLHPAHACVAAVVEHVELSVVALLQLLDARKLAEWLQIFPDVRLLVHAFENAARTRS